MPRPFTPLVINQFKGEEDSTPSLGETQAASLIQNLYLVNGGLERRLGQTLINTAQASTTPVQGLAWCRIPDTSPAEYVVGVQAGSFFDFYNAGVAAAPTAITGGSARLSMDDTLTLDMAVVEGKLYAADGTNAMVRFNGTNVKKAGAAKPTTAPSAVDSGVAGVINGTVSYRVTYLDADGNESEASDASTPVTVASKKTTVTIPNDTDTDRTGKNLYRQGVVSTDFKFVTALSASATTYTDNIADASLGASVTTIGQTLFPSCSRLWEHDNRLFGCGNATNPNILYISTEFTPWQCPASPDLTLPSQGLQLKIQGRNARIIGGISHGAYCFLFTDEGGYILQGTSAEDYRIERFTVHGCTSHRSIQTSRNWLFWVGPEGIYRYDGINVIRIDVPIQQFFYKASAQNLSQAVSWYYNDRYYVAFPSDGTGTGIYAGAQPGQPGGGVAAINPNTLSGWQVIADARSIVGHVDNDVILAWPDTSGNSHNGSGGAYYRTSGGLPWVEFYHPGAFTSMNFSVGGAPISCTSGFSFYAIYRQEGLNAAQSNPNGFADSFLAQMPAVNGFTVWAQKFQSATPGSTNSAIEFDSNVIATNPASIALPFSTSYLVYVTVIAQPPIDTGTVFLYVNGSLVATATGWHLSPSDNLSGTGMVIGNGADSSTRQLQAKVGWLGWANTAHGATTRKGVEKYLTSVWS